MEALKGFFGNVKVRESNSAPNSNVAEKDDSLWATNAANVIQQEFLTESFFEKLKMSVN